MGFLGIESEGSELSTRPFLLSPPTAGQTYREPRPWPAQTLSSVLHFFSASALLCFPFLEDFHYSQTVFLPSAKWCTNCLYAPGWLLTSVPSVCARSEGAPRSAAGQRAARPQAGPRGKARACHQLSGIRICPSSFNYSLVLNMSYLFTDEFRT